MTADRGSWLAEQIAAGALPPPGGAEVHAADAAFCRGATGPELGRELLRLALAAAELAGDDVRETNMVVPGNFLSRLLVLHAHFARTTR